MGDVYKAKDVRLGRPALSGTNPFSLPSRGVLPVGVFGVLGFSVGAGDEGVRNPLDPGRVDQPRVDEQMRRLTEEAGRADTHLLALENQAVVGVSIRLRHRFPGGEEGGDAPEQKPEVRMVGN